MPVTRAVFPVLICLFTLAFLTIPVMGDSHEPIELSPEEAAQEGNSSNNSSELSPPENNTSQVSIDGGVNSTEENSGEESGAGSGKKGDEEKEHDPEEVIPEPPERSIESEKEETHLEVPQKENAILPIPADTNVVGTGNKFRDFLMNGINGENATLLITGGLFIVVFVLGASVFNTLLDGGDSGNNSALELSSVLISPLAVRAGRVKSDFDAGFAKSKEMKLRSLDDIFDSIVALGIGDPRLTTSSKKNKTIRIYNCIECERTRSRKENLCDFTKGFLTGGFRSIQKGSIEVEETKCYGSGADYCEYSIVFGR